MCVRALSVCVYAHMRFIDGLSGAVGTLGEYLSDVPSLHYPAKHSPTVTLRSVPPCSRLERPPPMRRARLANSLRRCNPDGRHHQIRSVTTATRVTIVLLLMFREKNNITIISSICHKT